MIGSTRGAPTVSDPRLVSRKVAPAVLIFAPVAAERAVFAAPLEAADVPHHVCTEVEALDEGMAAGPAVLLLTEAGLAAAKDRLVRAWAAQPAAFDFPVILMGDARAEERLRSLRPAPEGTEPNVTLIEPGCQPATLVSAVRSALRLRETQLEIRRLSQTVRSGEERERNILDGISDAFVTIDRDWRFVYANASYMALVSPLYRSEDELIGKVVWEKFPDIEDREVGRFYRTMMEATEPANLELYYPPLQAWLSIRAFPSAAGLSLYVQNITERKQREKEVEDLNRKIQDQARIFDATLSNIVDLVYSFDRQGRVIYANRPLLEIWKRPLAEVLGKTVYDLDYPPELADRLHNQLLQVAATGQPIRGEVVYLNANGGSDIHAYIFSPVLDPDGEVSAVVGTTRLMTAYRQAEGAMRHLAAIVQFSDDAIISKSLDGIITSWNRGAERLFGYAAEEMIGRSVLTLIPAERHAEEPEIVGRICGGEPVENYETVRVRKDGSRVTVSLTVSPIKDEAGNVVGASKIARDITEQKRIERDLQEAKESAEAASRSKDHFLAVLSHELRTPLTPVLMTASALEMDPSVPSNLRAEMAMIRRNVELETKLIDDLLDLSRITMGKLALNLRTVDLNGAMRQVCAICDAEAADRGVRLKIIPGENLGAVSADPARLQQMLWNLLKNAIKFTPAGGLVEVFTEKVGARRVRISVRDNGVGISREALPKIFDAFEQGGTNVTRQFGGLGLGLAITKALVELHEGTISAESDGPNLGSVFRIELPMSTVSAVVEGADSITRNDESSMRVLIVEDHKDTATMLAKLLGGLGYDVTVENMAADGLRRASEENFDILVSDLGLPDMNGYEFMMALRAEREIKGIAMSGYGTEDDIRRSLEAGFSEHLVKPVSLTSLVQAIQRIAEK